jgi:hypothetical protein
MEKLAIPRWMEMLQGLLLEVHAFHCGITVTCLLISCSECRFQFLHWQTFQWFPLIGERSTLDVPFSFFIVLDSSVSHGHWKSEVGCHFDTCQYVPHHVLKYLFLSLTGIDLCFPLLSIFHPLAMKFVLTIKFGLYCWMLQCFTYENTLAVF